MKFERLQPSKSEQGETPEQKFKAEFFSRFKDITAERMIQDMAADREAEYSEAYLQKTADRIKSADELSPYFHFQGGRVDLALDLVVREPDEQKISGMREYHFAPGYVGIARGKFDHASFRRLFEGLKKENPTGANAFLVSIFNQSFKGFMENVRMEKGAFIADSLRVEKDNDSRAVAALRDTQMELRRLETELGQIQELGKFLGIEVPLKKSEIN